MVNGKYTNPMDPTGFVIFLNVHSCLGCISDYSFPTDWETTTPRQGQVSGVSKREIFFRIFTATWARFPFRLMGWNHHLDSIYWDLFNKILIRLFFTYCHGKAPFFTTIWDDILCFTFSKYLKQIQVNDWLLFNVPFRMGLWYFLDCSDCIKSDSHESADGQQLFLPSTDFTPTKIQDPSSPIGSMYGVFTYI